MTSTDNITISGITFTRAAAENIEATGVDVADDLDRLIRGDRTADSLLADCLDGIDGDEGFARGWLDYVDALARHAGVQSRTRYEVRGSASIRSSDDHATLDDARSAVRQQRDGLVYEEWDDGSIAYYASQAYSDADETGDDAIAIVTKMER